MHVGTVAGTVSLAALVWACGDGIPADLPSTGEILVASQTSGDPIETDGFVVRLDGEDRDALPAGGSIVLTGLEPGDHRLELAGVADGCTVQGANPRLVHAQAAETVQSVFLVTCVAPGTGRIFVQSSTYSATQDDYLIEVNGVPTHTIGTRDTVTLRAITAGAVTLQLTRLGQCLVTGPNPRTIVVRVSQTVGTIFKLRCDLPLSGGPQPLVQRAAPR